MSRLLLTSLHKSGTAMLTQAIGDGLVFNGMVDWKDKHPHPYCIEQFDNFDRFARAHMPHASEYVEIFREKGIKTIFLYRDLRDTIVSWAYWIDKIKDYKGWINLEIDQGKVRLEDLSIPNRINAILDVAEKNYSRYVGWLDTPDDIVFKLCYEDMRDDREKTFLTLIEWMGKDLADKMGCPIPGVMINRIDPQNCSTFRHGIIGDWKNHFTEENIELFWTTCGYLMEKFGYEKLS